MPIIPLLKTRNYFINTQGYVFKIENGKEVKVKTIQTPKSKRVLVLVENKYLDLLHLMIQHFIGDVKFTDKIKFTINKDLEINLTSIIIKKSLGKGLLTAEDEVKMFNYKCSIKANASNGRCKFKISGLDVYRVLIINDFKCIYCGDNIVPTDWHLDHFSALSKGGRNILENIVPSCSRCNIMKGALDGNQFYSACIKIVNKYAFKDNTTNIL